MKKIQLVLTLFAFTLAGAGVFASSNARFTIDPRIDSDDPDNICDQSVTVSGCNASSGPACQYIVGETTKNVFDKQTGSCVLMHRPN